MLTILILFTSFLATLGTLQSLKKLWKEMDEKVKIGRSFFFFRLRVG